MRISRNQSDILFLLYGIEQQRGKSIPIPVMALFDMVQKNRNRTLHANHFRTSCHKLHEHGLIAQFRNKSLNLAYTLTDQGRDIALEIYTDRVINQ